jgi:hypothetical protein
MGGAIGAAYMWSIDSVESKEHRAESAR